MSTRLGVVLAVTMAVSSTAVAQTVTCRTGASPEYTATVVFKNTGTTPVASGAKYVVTVGPQNKTVPLPSALNPGQEVSVLNALSPAVSAGTPCSCKPAPARAAVTTMKNPTNLAAIATLAKPDLMVACNHITNNYGQTMKLTVKNVGQGTFTIPTGTVPAINVQMIRKNPATGDKIDYQNITSTVDPGASVELTFSSFLCAPEHNETTPSTYSVELYYDGKGHSLDANSGNNTVEGCTKTQIVYDIVK